MRVIQVVVIRGNVKIKDLFIIDDGKEITFGDENSLSESERHLLKLDQLIHSKSKTITAKVDCYTSSLFETLLRDSDIIRARFMNTVFASYRRANHFILINVNLSEPRKEVMDQKGSGLFEQLGLERREVDHAMAWFSTLGGAFSALGDCLDYCAVMAGKISLQQFKLALRLNDPFLIARCRLYLSLSLIQQGYFKEAKRIILSQYAFATKDNYDQKLISMCHGIAAKWRYDRKKFKHNKCILLKKIQ
ncbi:uncharacterized protein F58A4.6 [Cimex lectularius]|uniref:Uncharacterized protein n=1 Tax=Cimex lectularius TaxID=79782 RepID=A0A8I6RCS5_CIMLE|nr:uncharacterized protein F58A4.6 [Cimex lectularius]